MPILLIFLVTAACLDRVPWPNPMHLAPRNSVLLTGGVVALVLSAAFAVRTRVVRTLHRDPGRRLGAVARYASARRVLFFVNLGAVILSVLGFGWGRTVHDTATMTRNEMTALAPFAELLVPLPYFLILIGCWVIYFDVERELHKLTTTNHVFWTRLGYVFQQLRQLALLVGLPVGLFVAQQSLARWAPELTREDWYRIASFAAVPVLILFMPLLIKPLLGLQSMPAGPTRDRLETLARRLGFRYTDLLLWPTRGAVANAMIVGLIPRARYVIFTDRLLDEMPADELDGVFGHEVGHAKHGHIWYYAAFLILSMIVLAVAGWMVETRLHEQLKDNPGVWYADYLLDDGWMALPPVAVAAGYIFLVFGFLSRRCERQADVFGCRAVSCEDVNCTGHDETTTFPAHGRGLCPTGIRTFVRGLERVKLLGGMDDAPPGRGVGSRARAMAALLRAWLHSTIARRVHFLLSIIDDRERERRFQRRVRWLRWGLLALLLAVLVGLGTAVGWRELLRAL